MNNFMLMAPSNQTFAELFSNGVIFDISDRLGNMVLLEKDELKRAYFFDKKTAEYSNWNLQNLNRYQMQLLKHGEYCKLIKIYQA